MVTVSLHRNAMEVVSLFIACQSSYPIAAGQARGLRWKGGRPLHIHKFATESWDPDRVAQICERIKKSKPDIVLLSPPAPWICARSEPQSLIGKVVSKIKKEAPASRVVLVSPLPLLVGGKVHPKVDLCAQRTNAVAKSVGVEGLRATWLLSPTLLAKIGVSNGQPMSYGPMVERTTTRSVFFKLLPRNQSKKPNRANKAADLSPAPYVPTPAVTSSQATPGPEYVPTPKNTVDTGVCLVAHVEDISGRDADAASTSETQLFLPEPSTLLTPSDPAVDSDPSSVDSMLEFLSGMPALDPYGDEWLIPSQ
jgi:hypothetical protein